MPAAPITTPADAVAATRRKLARLLAVGAMRAAAVRAAEPRWAPDQRATAGLDQDLAALGLPVVPGKALSNIKST